jgi:hypothetical protein
MWNIKTNDFTEKDVFEEKHPILKTSEIDNRLRKQTSESATD